MPPIRALESASMRLPRPSSLNSLMLTGFALVSIPLLLGVVIAGYQSARFVRNSATLVRSGVQTTHYTQQLFQQIAPIERSAKLYQVLNDPGLLEVYRDSRERLLATLASIETVAIDPARAVQVQSLEKFAEAHRCRAVVAYAGFARSGAQTRSTPSQPMWQAAFELSAATGEQVETRAVAPADSRPSDTQKYLFWQSAVLILLTALLVGGVHVPVDAPDPPDRHRDQPARQRHVLQVHRGAWPDRPGQPRPPAGMAARAPAGAGAGAKSILAPYVA